MREGGGPEAADHLGDAARVAGWTALGRIASFVVIILMAARFGMGEGTDVFFLAAKIPMALLLFAQTRLPGLVVSLYSEYRYHLGDREAGRFAHAAVNAAALAGGALVLLAIPASRPFAHLIASGLEPAAQENVVFYFRLLMPIVIAGGIAGVLRGLLQAHRIFGPPAAEALVVGLCLVASILAFGRTYHLGSVVLGYAVGSVARLILLLPGLVGKASWEDRWTLFHPGVGRLGALLAPLAAMTAVFQITVLVGRALASRLPAGSVSALEYAERLAGVPVELFVYALCTVLLPRLVDLRIRRSEEVLGAEVVRGMRLTLLLLLPCAAGFAFLARPLIRLVYQGEVFLPSDTASAAAVLAASGVVLVASVCHVGELAYYALQKTWVVLLAGGAMFVVNLAAAVVLLRIWPHPAALPLAQGIGAFAALGVYLAFLARDCRPLDFRPLARSLVTGLLGTVWMSVFVYATLFLVERLWPGEGKVEALVHVAAPGTIGVLVYGLVLRAMRAEELPDLMGLLGRSRRQEDGGGSEGMSV